MQFNFSPSKQYKVRVKPNDPHFYPQKGHQMMAIKEVTQITATWLVTFWQGGTLTVEARTELEAIVAAARAAPWAEVKRIEAWD